MKGGTICGPSDSSIDPRSRVCVCRLRRHTAVSAETFESGSKRNGMLRAAYSLFARDFPFHIFQPESVRIQSGGIARTTEDEHRVRYLLRFWETERKDGDELPHSEEKSLSFYTL